MKEVLKESSLNEHRQEKEYGWKPPIEPKKIKERNSKYISVFLGIIIGLLIGITTSIYMHKDTERCKLLIEENKLLKDMMYYRDINPMPSP